MPKRPIPILEATANQIAYVHGVKRMKVHNAKKFASKDWVTFLETKAKIENYIESLRMEAVREERKKKYAAKKAAEE